MQNFKANPIKGSIEPTDNPIREDGLIRTYSSEIDAWNYINEIAQSRLKSAVEGMESAREHLDKVRSIRPKKHIYLCRRGESTQGKWVATEAYDEVDQLGAATSKLNFCRLYAAAEFEWMLIGRSEYIELQTNQNNNHGL